MRADAIGAALSLAGISAFWTTVAIGVYGVSPDGALVAAAGFATAGMALIVREGFRDE